ncbi:DUF1254 domain-containing protein [Chitinophaga lutea]
MITRSRLLISGKTGWLALAVIALLIAACGQRTREGKQGNNGQTGEAAGVFHPADAHERAVYSAAFNAVLWGMPAVNAELMHESLVQAKGDYNQVVYWSGLINAKNQTLTPNPGVIYINPMYDTRNGPVVLEIPPVEGVSSLTGSIDDSWQTAIEDVGPAGVDKGKGGKYLILPPGYTGKVPEGYFPMPSAIYTGFVILRSNLTDGSPEDLRRAIDYGKRVRIYPLSQAAQPPQTVFVDLLQTPFGNIIPYDIKFFHSLNDFVQREPWLTRDMAMIDPLKTIGIEKGKPFTPDGRTKEILNAAIADVHQYLDNRYQAVFTPPFYEGTHWALPASPEMVKAISENYTDPNNYPINDRAMSYSMAYFSTKHLGTGQFYLMTIRDKEGHPFDGAKSYRLHLPADVPVKLYWSMTLYDRETHALIPTVDVFSRASTTPGLLKNADGSVDLYFAPSAPSGKTSNWIPTDPKRGFEVLARFYGPEQGFFEKKWTMGDVEEVR